MENVDTFWRWFRTRAIYKMTPDGLQSYAAVPIHMGLAYIRGDAEVTFIRRMAGEYDVTIWKVEQVGQPPMVIALLGSNFFHASITEDIPLFIENLEEP